MLRRHILAPAGASASCTVKPGTRVFLWYSTECSDVERGTAFFAVGEAAQAQCARALDEATVRSLVLTIDGVALEIRKRRFEVISAQRAVDLPAGNILSGTAERANVRRARLGRTHAPIAARRACHHNHAEWRPHCHVHGQRRGSPPRRLRGSTQHSVT